MSQDTLQDTPPAQALGLSGHLTRLFIDSPLTPLLLLAGLAFGLLALGSLPREEEPQISVPMVDVQVRADGLAAADAIELVTKPLEEILKAIAGVEHIYSQTADDSAIVTARFVVGTTADEAILRVHEKIRANFGRIPHGIPEPLIVGRGIDDVAILTLTLSPRPEAIARWDDTALHAVADTLLAELVKVPDVGLAYLVGGRPEQIRIEPDPERLALLGITLNQVVEKLRHANRSFVVGDLRHEGGSRPVVAGQTLQGVADIGLLLLTTRDGRPVYLKDVATVVVGGAPLEHRVWHLIPAPAPDKDAGTLTRAPAVTLALAKRAGANAVVIADAVLTRLHALEAQALPVDLMLTVTRNYGETAAEKADELLFHLTLATLSIVALVAVAIGWREGLVVLVVIPTTILLTLFASWLLGYTINRVSLFALIFSIGILVDDAIVLVENIHRHWSFGGAAMADRGARRRAAIAAVAEVGNPTVIATLTVIVALLTMMFVSGLMGPYMSPIPANASAAMLFSFFVAVMLVPWLMVRLRGAGGAGGHGGHCASGGKGGGGDSGGWLGRAYLRVARPLLAGRRRAWAFLLLVGLATLASTAAFYRHDVTVKLLPFDNKSELQVTVDLPAGAALEDTERVLFAAANRLTDLPELSHLQLYAGTAAPFNFNGLVRHGYLRHAPELGELQLALTPRHARSRPSHDIALDVRRRLAGVAAAAGVRRSGAGDGDVGGPAAADVGAGASDVGIDVGAAGAPGSDDTLFRVGAAGSDDTIIRVNEVPPGPPVLATLLAEVYGPDAATRAAAAERVAAAFRAVDFIVDIDRTARPPGERLRFALDRERLEFFGVEEQAVYDTLQALVGGVAIGYSHRGDGRDPVEIAVRLPKAGLFASERLLATPVPTRADVGTGSTGGMGGMGGAGTGTGTGGSGGSAAAVVELGDLVTIRREPASAPRFRRDGRDAEMVMGELAGRYEAPIYGLLAVNERLAGLEREGGDGAHADKFPLPAPIQVRLHGQPEDESVPTLLWDGEWEITWVTFRDMGAAFAVALLGIYLLVVAQFHSFKLPLVVLLPVPLTLIGIVGGHWLFSASFTAASMIGFIALAGIIVRNSILLIDFIRHRRDGRTPLRDVVLEAGAIRFRPILLTALAAMIGAAFILADPIFQGLAISLLFGLLSSTLLTVLVIPAVYLVLRRR